MTEPMTLLQRGVIQRLRDAGQPAIADHAHDHWRLGLRVADDTVAGIQGPELRADFVRANEHTRTSR